MPPLPHPIFLAARRRRQDIRRFHPTPKNSIDSRSTTPYYQLQELKSSPMPTFGKLSVFDEIY
jgi:hypothetical protein